MFGYAGKILVVDLASGAITAEPLNADYAAQYIGGAGLAARYLFDALGPATDPLGPDNPLIFMTGPLDATGAPSAGRFVVVARSPQTGLYGEANAGNFFGPDLKAAGYDGIIVRGKSPVPVYLFVRESRVELRDARHLMGKNTFDTGDAIRAELDEPRLTVAAIGPAGEKLVKYALILATNPRPGAKKGIAGRCGLGAVMGSKKLKAIAVHAGKKPLPLHTAARLQEIAHSSVKSLREDMSTQVLHAAGTASGIDLASMMGNFPTRYWTGTGFPAETISGNTLAEQYPTKSTTCHACMVACGHRVNIGNQGFSLDAPEYETSIAFGAMMLNTDLAMITQIGWECDALGIDSITAGSTIAFATYLREQGVLPKSFKLSWGNPQQALELVGRIAYRQGIGDVLAEGTRALGKRYGVEGLAVQVNGLEPAMHDPRALYGMALVYATSPVGASHNFSDYYWVEQFARPIDSIGITGMDRFETAGKAANIIRHQNWRSFGSSLVMCIFPNLPVENLCDMVSAATGFDITPEVALNYGERMWNLKRLINLKLGYHARTSEKLPELLLRPLAEGEAAGHVPPLEPMLREYYALRDWDWETGWPRAGKLAALGMEELAGEIENVA